MELKQLISLKRETEGILQKYNYVYEIKEFESFQELQLYIQMIKIHETIQHCKEGIANICEKIDNLDEKKLYLDFCYSTENTEAITLQECLLITATDELIAWGKTVEIATLAYANPNICGQTLSGVEMIIEGFEEVDAEFLKRVWQRYYRLPWTIAVTKRCVIRELTLEDMDGLFGLYEDEKISKFTESLFDREEETEYQRAYIENMYRYFGYGIWLVFHKETGELIGRAGLEHREVGEELDLELGYLIGTNYQRQGYATEVCKAILTYAKEEICASCINCFIEEGNVASIALAKKLGFTFLENFMENKKKMLRFHMQFIS